MIDNVKLSTYNFPFLKNKLKQLGFKINCKDYKSGQLVLLFISNNMVHAVSNLNAFNRSGNRIIEEGEIMSYVPQCIQDLRGTLNPNKLYFLQDFEDYEYGSFWLYKPCVDAKQLTACDEALYKDEMHYLSPYPGHIMFESEICVLREANQEEIEIYKTKMEDYYGEESILH